jgi:hypothetical protein
MESLVWLSHAEFLIYFLINVEQDQDGTCVFPFIYKNVTYDRCTIAGAHPHPPAWCSTVANYDKDRKWKNCGKNNYI